MQSGNGIDLAAIYQLLQEVARQVGAHNRRFDLIDRRFEQIDQRFEQIDQRFDRIAEVLNEHTQKIDDLTAGVSELRASLQAYHGSVVGHGLRLTELDQRVSRIERHLKLEPDAG